MRCLLLQQTLFCMAIAAQTSCLLYAAQQEAELERRKLAGIPVGNTGDLEADLRPASRRHMGLGSALRRLSHAR